MFLGGMEKEQWHQIRYKYHSLNMTISDKYIEHLRNNNLRRKWKVLKKPEASSDVKTYFIISESNE